MAKKLNQITGMPQMSVAFSGWRTTFTLVVVTTSIDDNGFNVPSEVSYTYSGTVQPLSAEAIELKPDAQRGFEWLQVHVTVGSQPLSVGDNVIYGGKSYRVQAKKDYSLNNYIEYHIMENTQNG